MRHSVGIITKYFAFNIGAFLQTHAMVQTVRSLGYEAELVEHMHTARPAHMLYRQLGARTWPQFAFKFRQWREFLRARALLPISRPFHTGLRYDAVVIGSDELWNLRNRSIGYNPLYFSHGAPAERVISYASSFGGTEWSPQFPAGVAAGLQQFAHLSARDDNTREIIHRLTGREVPVVLDPTLLYDYGSEEIPCPEEGYYLLYGPFSPPDTARLRDYAHRQGKRLIAVAVYNAGCDANIVTSPYAWLGYYRRAEGVITSMYHGTIFALKYQKPFAVIMRRQHRANKISALVARVGTERQVVDHAEGIEDVLGSPPDWADVTGRLAELRAGSLAYLQQALP